jgi:phage terminase large subunit
VTVKLPEWSVWLDVPLAPDHLPVRHRVLWGGRGGAKSWTIAEKLIERAYQGRERILCAREYQNSIRDSSKKLIDDTINRLGFGLLGNGFFVSTEREIRGRNGSLFTFLGLNGKEASIKSLEGYTLAWVEEAATLSQSSIDALIPTIRQEGSEIWWSYNPRLPTDPVDEMFRGKRGKPPGSIVIEVHWNDNPWFPQVLLRDMEYDRLRDPDKHAHVWLGAYVQRSEAKVFRNWAIMPFDTPDDAVLRLGSDWGYSQDPTVIVRCFIGRWTGEPGRSYVVADPKGRCLFIDHEAYKVGCEIDDTPALFAGTDTREPGPRWSNPHGHRGIPGALRWQITADSSRPETISYMKAKGFRIEPAVKGRGSVEEGITFLQSYDIYVHPRCKHAAVEMTHYSWKTDKQTGEILPVFADDNNHVIDALRYALEGARRAGSGKFESMSAGPRTSIVGPSRDPSDWFDSPDGHQSAGWGSAPGLWRGILDSYRL